MKNNDPLSESNFPTAEEVCETIELMALLNDSDDSNSTLSLMYRLTHCRKCDKRCGNPHEDWVEEFRKVQAYILNQNKAPRDPTKIRNLDNPVEEIQ